MMPAIATGSPFEQIISVFSSTRRCTPSSVSKSNGLSKRLTWIESTFAQSNACIGWPSSSIR